MAPCVTGQSRFLLLSAVLTAISASGLSPSEKPALQVPTAKWVTSGRFSFQAPTQSQVDPAIVFQRVRTRLLGDWNRMSRYSCTQNITRSFYLTDTEGSQSCSGILARRATQKRHLPLTIREHMELEVAVAGGGEVHSWPGASKFEEQDDIEKLTGNGAFGTGDFVALIGGVFGGSATIKFDGARNVNGRSLFGYSFQVLKSASQYEVKSTAGPIVTAYEGTFLLDPQAEDLVHLTVTTAELPAGTESCQASHDIEYARTDIRGDSVLIPQKTTLRLVLRNGNETATAISYSACRKFTGTAVLRFDNPGATEARTPIKDGDLTAGAKVPVTPVPPGLKFECRIVTPIDSSTPAGAAIEAILRTPLRDKDGTILAPSGEHIHGRLVRLAQHFGVYDYFEIGVRLESVQVNGRGRPLFATLVDEQSGPLPPVAGMAEQNPMKKMTRMGSLANTGEFFVVKERFRLSGLNSQWMTTLPEANHASSATVSSGSPENSGPTTSTAGPAMKEPGTELPPVPAAPASGAVTPPDESEPPTTASAPAMDLPQFRVQVESNLVIVRAVVRDANGKAVEGLSEGDFKVLDKGKVQAISQFEVENSGQEQARVPSGQSEPRSAIVAHPSRTVPSFVALYFDDLNTSDTDMIDARDAAVKYLGEAWRANQRIGVFTATGTLSAFTTDAAQVRSALAKLHVSAQGLTRDHECPQLSDYQALQIAHDSEDLNSDAMKTAIDEAKHRCGMGMDSKDQYGQRNSRSGEPPQPSSAVDMITARARSIAAQVEAQARDNLKQLERLVMYLGQFPGHRTIVLVSPGFLSDSEKDSMDRIIDRALRLQVVISSLDPRGLALLMRESDVTRDYVPNAKSGAIAAVHNVDFAREMAASEVLSALADGTGGDFFHNNNNLQGGLDALAGPRSYYILAFAPKKLDGKFHKIEVKLKRSKGIVTARRGYFAVSRSNAQAAQ